MALRHHLPGTVLPEFGFVQEPERPPTLARKPKEVVFRSGKDVKVLAQEVLGYAAVRLSAAVGAGKSTKMPLQLAEESKMPVLHVVPSRLLAVHLYDYLSKLHPGKYLLSLDPADPIGKTGVTISYSANVCAILLAKGTAMAFAEYGEMVLFLDECHESDAFTFTLASVAHLVAGVKSVVSSSATYEADRTPMSEPKGRIESRMFSKKNKPSTWDPLDVNMPWSVSEMSGNALFYVDNDKEASKLVEKYNSAGATAYRLSSKMPVQAFRDAMVALNNPNAGIVIFVADYSFRSGFTLDIDRIVDSGVVQYVDVENGSTVLKLRKAYMLERVQAQGRGARLEGSSCVYYQPDFEADSAICLLEGAEMDAAAVMFRCLGFAVPALIRHATLAVGKVPIDLCRTFNLPTPLSLLAAQDLKSLVKDLVAEGKSVSSAGSVEDVIGSYLANTPPPSPVDFFSSSLGKTNTQHTAVDGGGLEFLQQLRMMAGSAATLIPGRYYGCAGLPTQDVYSRLYGEDWRQALKEIVLAPDVVVGFDPSDRLEVVAQLLVQYNRAVATAAGINSMLLSQEGLTAMMTRYPNHVKEWSDYVGQALRESESDFKALLKALEILRTNTVLFVPIDPDVMLEKQIAQGYADRLINAVALVNSAVDSDAIMSHVAQGIGMAGGAPDDRYDKLDVKTGTGVDHALVRVVPCRVGSKQMQDVYVRVERTAMWSQLEYKNAVSKYLSTMGLSVSSIRGLYFPGTKVDPGKVLQELRDDGDFRHRAVREFKLLPVVGSSKKKRLLSSSSSDSS